MASAGVSAGVGLANAKTSRARTQRYRRCERSDSEVSEQIFDLTGGKNYMSDIIGRKIRKCTKYTKRRKRNVKNR